MWKKVKQFTKFLIKGTFAGWSGFLGFVLFAIGIFLAFQLLFGENNLVRAMKNSYRINNQELALNNELSEIKTLEHHIELIQNHSKDYIEELSQKYLNSGASDNKIVKITD